MKLMAAIWPQRSFICFPVTDDTRGFVKSTTTDNLPALSKTPSLKSRLCYVPIPITYLYTYIFMYVSCSNCKSTCI